MIGRIAINTCGGDAPGLNAVLRSATLAAIRRGWEIVGVRQGFLGLLEGSIDGQPGLRPLTEGVVSGIGHRGGTILGTTTRGQPFGIPPGCAALAAPEELSATIARRIREEAIDALVVIGGDGSLSSAHLLHQQGVPVVGVPKTIDNDLGLTDVTFGFRTAVEVATDALGRLHTTAESHERVIVVEVMGRHAGWIALESGLAGGADVILIPEIPFSFDAIVDKVRDRDLSGRRFSVIVVAEGAHPADGEPSYLAGSGRYGGIAERVAREIEVQTGKEARTLVLGHILRGGEPIGFDRVLALQLGAAAIQLVADGAFGQMVSVRGQAIEGVPIENAIRETKRVPLAHHAISTARGLGICFGDSVLVHR